MAGITDITLKRYNGTDDDILHPTTNWGQVEDKPTTFPPTSHNHVEADITDLDKYTQAEADAKFAIIGENPLFNSILLDTSPTGIVHEAGRIHWDEAKNQPAMDLGVSGVELNFGFESFVPIKNAGSIPFLDGTVVYPVGFEIDGNGTYWFLADIANSHFKQKISPLAVVTQPMAVGAYGYATKLGLVGNVNTVGLTVGDRLYVDNSDTATNFTNVRPLDGSYPSTIGFVAEVGATGSIQIDITESELTVDVTNQNGFPRSERFKSHFSVDTVAHEFTLVHDNDYYFYDEGIKYEKYADETIAFNDTEGLVLFKFVDGVLDAISNVTETQYQETILNDTILAVGYWNVTGQRFEFLLDERHGLMNPETHLQQHQSTGTFYTGGMSLGITNIDGNGNALTDIEFSVSEGYNKDEDIEHVLTEKLITDTIEEKYFSGVSGVLRTNSTNVYCLSKGTTYPYINEFTGATWQLTELTSDSYFFRHIYGIPNEDKTVTNYIGFMGTSSYGSKDAAEGGILTEKALIESQMPAPEYTHAYSIMYHTKVNQNNTYKSAIVSLSDGNNAFDFRQETSKSSASVSATSHPTLTQRDAANSHPISAITGLQAELDSFLVEADFNPTNYPLFVGADGTNGTNGTDGTDGTNGTNGTNGTDGTGWTGGNYNSTTGIITFASSDGLGFITGDLRGADGSDGTDGTNGTNGTDGTNGADGADGAAGADGADGDDALDASGNLVLGSGTLTWEVVPSAANMQWKSLGTTTRMTLTNAGILDVAIKDQRDSTAIKFWTGTQAQYDAITTPSSDIIYYITE